MMGMIGLLKIEMICFDQLISDSEKMLQTKFMQWYSDKNKRGQYKKCIR